MNREIANREGIDIRLLDYKTKKPFTTIDYGNVSVVDLTGGDRAFATGGRKGGRRVAFDGQRLGTVKISSQLIPLEYISLAANGEVKDGAELLIREALVAAEGGTITLSKAPVAGTIYTYAEGEPESSAIAATAADTLVTIEGAQAGDKYVAIYVHTSATAKKVVFNNKSFPKDYIIWADTFYKDEDGEIVGETIHAFKATPQTAISMTYQGTGDPMSLDITFDLSEDANSDVIEYIRDDAE